MLSSPQVYSSTSHLKFPRNRNIEGCKSSRKKDLGKEVTGVNKSSFKKKATSNLKINSPLIQNVISQKDEHYIADLAQGTNAHSIHSGDLRIALKTENNPMILNKQLSEISLNKDKVVFQDKISGSNIGDSVESSVNSLSLIVTP